MPVRIIRTGFFMPINLGSIYVGVGIQSAGFLKGLSYWNKSFIRSLISRWGVKNPGMQGIIFVCLLNRI